LTVGHTVDEAVWWFITMERSCQAQLLAEAAGTPVFIDKDMAAHTAKQVGNHFSGWLNFQPLYERIVREQPDLLD
jgi:ribulose-5-phosphate 4-epimerase/fuculose-1-phosphate aldolase